MLFRWKDGEIDVRPEALLVAAFNDIWKSDKSKDKATAMKYFTLLYFMHDPRSEYMVETDEKARLELVKSHVGIAASMEKDALYKRAVGVYKELTETTSSRLLATNRKVLKKVSDYVLEADVTDDNVARIVKAIADLNTLSVNISKAEREIRVEVEDATSRAMSNANLTLGDADFGGLFK
jgi:hypothetical protein